MIKRWAAAIGLVLLLWGTSCRHTYQHNQTATRAEKETSQFQTAASAESNKQSVAEKKQAASKRTREFDPATGRLVKDVLEQYQSDGKVTTVDVSASRSTAEGGASRSAAASSSSSKASDTKAGTVSLWWWLLLLVPLGVAGWLLRKRVRSFIPLG